MRKFWLDIGLRLGTAALCGVMWSILLSVAIGGSPYSFEMQVKILLAALIFTVALGFLVVVVTILYTTD